MVISACEACSWLLEPHLWAQDVFWCLVLVVFKILCRLKRVSKGVVLPVVKEALRKCMQKFFAVGVEVFLFRPVRWGIVCQGGTGRLGVRELLIDVLLY